MGRQVAGLAFGVVGGLVGGLFTAGTFSATGFAIGQIVGGLVLGQPQAPTPGPQLNKTLEGSELDVVIPELYGTVGNVRGNIINVARDKNGHAAGILEVTKKTKAAGKGIGGEEGEESTYFLIAEYLLCNTYATGPVFVDLIRQETGEGTKILYDRFGPTLKKKGFDLTPEYASDGTLIAEISDRLRLYPGTAQQMPDSAMQSYYPDGVTAHRYSAKVVFNRLKIEAQPSFTFVLRCALTGRRQIVQTRLELTGVPTTRIALNKINGNTKGVILAGETGTREFSEKLAARVFCDFADVGGQIIDCDRKNPTIFTLDASRMAARSASTRSESGDGSGNDRARVQMCGPEELPSRLDVAFSDISLNYDNNTGSALRHSCDTPNQQNADLLMESDNLSDAVPLARALLDEMWLADREVTVSLLPDGDELAPGDVMQVPHKLSAGAVEFRDYRITEKQKTPDSLISLKGTPWSLSPYSQNSVPDVLRPAPGIPDAGDFATFVCDPPPISPDVAASAGFIVASTRKAKVALRTQPDGEGKSKTYDTVRIKAPATLGALTADFVAGNGATLDMAASCTVQAINGVFASSTPDKVRDGANTVLLENGRCFSFLDAEETAPGLFTLSGIIDVRRGSEWAGTAAASTRALLLTDADGDEMEGYDFLKVPPGKIASAFSPGGGLLLDAYFVAKPQGGDEGDPETETASRACDGNSIRPLSPALAAIAHDADGIVISWHERTAEFGTFWKSGASLPSSATGRWLVTLQANGYTQLFETTIEGAAPRVLALTNAQLSLKFGGIVPTLFDGQIQQYSTTTGYGHALPFAAL